MTATLDRPIRRVAHTGDVPTLDAAVDAGTTLAFDAVIDTNLADIVAAYDLGDLSGSLAHVTIRSEAPMTRLLVRDLATTTATNRARIAVGWVSRPLNDADLTESEASVEDGTGSAEAAVRRVHMRLGLPLTDICLAADIAWRTFQSWTPQTRPRVASQGRLWQLVQFTDDLRDLLHGEADSAQWVRAHPEVRQLIVDGQFNAVLDLLLTERARQGRYADSGAIGADEDTIAAPDDITMAPPQGKMRRRTGATLSRRGTRS